LWLVCYGSWFVVFHATTSLPRIIFATILTTVSITTPTLFNFYHKPSTMLLSNTKTSNHLPKTPTYYTKIFLNPTQKTNPSTHKPNNLTFLPLFFPHPTNHSISFAILKLLSITFYTNFLNTSITCSLFPNTKTLLQCKNRNNIHTFYYNHHINIQPTKPPINIPIYNKIPLLTLKTCSINHYQNPTITHTHFIFSHTT